MEPSNTNLVPYLQQLTPYFLVAGSVLVCALVRDNYQYDNHGYVTQAPLPNVAPTVASQGSAAMVQIQEVGIAGVLSVVENTVALLLANEGELETALVVSPPVFVSIDVHAILAAVTFIQLLPGHQGIGGGISGLVGGCARKCYVNRDALLRMNLVTLQELPAFLSPIHQ